MTSARLGLLFLLVSAAALGPLARAEAQAPTLDERAHRFGTDAAHAARLDPANAEAIVAARYREALALGPDDASRARSKAAFQRGYQEALAAPAPSAPTPSRTPTQSPIAAPPSPPSAARIYDITPARGVAWGQPVGPGQVFGPDINPIYVWFRHEGISAGTAIMAVWYFLGTATPYRIGEGSVTVTPPADWGQFNYELAAGKRWPEGEYRVELLVMGQMLAEARFRVATATPGVATPAPAPTSAVPAPAGRGQRYTHPTLGYALTVPAGWAIDSTVTESLVLRPAGSSGLLRVYARPLPPGDNATSTALGWEGRFLQPGAGTNLHTKLGGREIVVDGDRAYEGLYRGDEITAKAVFVGTRGQVFVIVGMFVSGEFPERAREFDQVVESFTTGGPAATPAPAPAPAPPPSNPLSDLLEGLGKILKGLGQ